MELRDSNERELQDLTKRFQAGQVTRRQFIQQVGLLIGGTALVPFLAACGAAETATQIPATKVSETVATAAPAITAAPLAGQPKKGGILKVAMMAEPTPLDSHMAGTQVCNNVTSHFQETLFGRSQSFAAKPGLAESYEVTDEAKTWTIALRQGVPFHNGKEMTSEDAVASVKRFLKLSGPGQGIGKLIDDVKAVDKYTLQILCNSPIGVLPLYLCQLYSPIAPAEILEAAGDAPVTEYIGTGPWKFEEFQPDRFTRLTRFDDYVSRDDEPDGFSGAKTAYVDEILFMSVPEPAVRFDGITTGEFHFSETIPSDNYEDLVQNPDTVPNVVKPFYYALAIFNMAKGMFTDIRMRQAVQKILNLDAIAQAAFGNPEFFRLGPSFCPPESAWFNEAGAEKYNNVDIEGAKALLKEAGYNGETIRWISSKDYWWLYGMGLTCKTQLEEVGMKVDLQVTDWATLVSRIASPDEFEMYITGYGSYNHPSQQYFFNEQQSPWWKNEKKDGLVKALFAETDPKKEMDLIGELQQLVYDEAPVMRICDHFVLRAYRQNLKGYIGGPDIYFHNTWIE